MWWTALFGDLNQMTNGLKVACNILPSPTKSSLLIEDISTFLLLSDFKIWQDVAICSPSNHVKTCEIKNGWFSVYFTFIEREISHESLWRLALQRVLWHYYLIKIKHILTFTKHFHVNSLKSEWFGTFCEGFKYHRAVYFFLNVLYYSALET